MEELQRSAADPLWDNESTRGNYALPLSVGWAKARLAGWQLARGIPENETYRIKQYTMCMSPESHIGPFRHAVDFLVFDGTPVLAAADGEITVAKETSDAWGPTSASRDDLNYLTILHQNGEYSQCCHLAQGSVTQSGLKVGDQVKRGQQVAIVGKTGWTDRDHLHFVVFRGEPKSFNGIKSLRIKFV